MSSSLPNLKVFDAVKELGERVKITGMNYSELKDCLNNGYNYIKGNVNISNQKIQSLSEFKDIIYKVEGAFDCNDNEIISFEGFPKICTSLDCSNNKIKSMLGIPLIGHIIFERLTAINPSAEELKIEGNNFHQLERVVGGKLYKYMDDYFYIDPMEIFQGREDHLYDLEKNSFEYLVGKNPELLSGENLQRYLEGFRSIYYKDLNNNGYLLKIENNFINIGNRKFLKKILLPEFHLNGGSIKDIEVLSLNENTVKINGKFYNKKVSKSLNK